MTLGLHTGLAVRSGRSGIRLVASAPASAFGIRHSSTRLIVFPALLPAAMAIFGSGVVCRPVTVVTTSPAAILSPTLPHRGPVS